MTSDALMLSPKSTRAATKGLFVPSRIVNTSNTYLTASFEKGDNLLLFFRFHGLADEQIFITAGEGKCHKYEHAHDLQCRHAVP